MTSSGTNLAVTKDGETYNKLQRPDDYHLSTNVSLPPLDPIVPSASRASKRKREHRAAAGSKRHKGDGSSMHPNDGKDRSRISGPVGDCGMRTSLPGLDDQEPLSDDSTSEALAYLRSVRSEASLIPTLLVAPAGNEIGDIRGDDENDDENDDDKYYTGDSESQIEQVVYHDGVWIAVGEERNDIGDQDDDDACDLSSPQQEYYILLLKRFRMHRDRLTDPMLRNTDRSSTTNFHNSAHEAEPSSKSKWLQMIDQNFPTLDRISKLNEAALYQAIQHCSSSLTYSRTITRQKSCWIWNLLALVGDAGTLDHMRISKLRDLGAQAGRLGTRLRGDAPPNDEHGNDDVLVVPDESRSSPDDHKYSNEIQNAEGILGESGPGTMATKLLTKTTDHDVSQTESRSQDQDVDRSKKCLSQSDADMSLSEDGSEATDVSDTTTLEQARARLLAQLGDRLVQPGGSSQLETYNPLRVSSQGYSLQGHADAGQQMELQQEVIRHKTWSPPAIETDDDIEASSTVLNEADTNTRATIDMILTIVAECYGQKDLLEFRGAW